MPSKGLSIYSYVSPHLTTHRYTVEFSVPGPDGVIVNGVNDNFTVKSLEMESKHIHGLTNYTGKFQWRVLKDGEEVASAHNMINSFNGDLEGGDMISTQHFSPIVSEDAIITYGFYDAGHGEAGLTNRDQCYVTICPRANQSWMGNLAPTGSPEADLPFARFVLPAPHDNGMNTMENADAVLKSVSPSHLPYLKELLPHLNFFNHLPDTAIAHMLPHIVYGTSVTQKKPISTMLELGARYFEFRPAKLLPLFQEISPLPNKFYFQHACIPGLPFEDFLDAQVAFLDTHPTEIVVVHIRYDNIPAACLKPTEEELTTLLTTAFSKAQNNTPGQNNPLTWTTDRQAFQTPISTLRTQNTRLILLQLAPKYDSWTAQAYATLSSTPIIASFDGMSTDGQLTSNTDLTILQCQATSQSIREVLVYSVVASNAATSCLSSTKAMGDMRTLPWIREHVNQRLRAERTVVVMNDFIDGATCETCIEVSRERLAFGKGGMVV